MIMPPGEKCGFNHYDLTRFQDHSSLNPSRKRSRRKTSRPDSPFQKRSGQSLNPPGEIDSPNPKAPQVITE